MSIPEQVMHYLNQVAGTNFQPDFPDTVARINKLVDIGYSISDFKTVIDKKWSHWKGTKYQQYVRPQTLFSDKFENYLNEQRSSKNAIQRIAESIRLAKSAFRPLDKKQ